MSTTSKYFDSLQEIQRFEYQIHFLEEDGVKGKEYETILNKLKSVKTEADNIKTSLEQINDHADGIRIGMITVANSLIEQFEYFRKYPFMFPDLNQNMIIPGYLIGKISHAFKDVVIFEGSYSSISIYPSKHEWNYDALESLIKEIRAELQNTQFMTLMDGVNFYQTIFDRTKKIVTDLREKGVI